MVCVPFIEPHVALKLVGCVCPLLLLTHEVRVFRPRLVQIAFVVAAGGRAVIFPFAHARPTEIVPTLQARHMVAALIFLDTFPTLRTRLCICLDPSDVLGLCTGFLQPLCRRVTIAGLVRNLTALEAEDSSTVALNFVEHAAEVLPFATKLAIGARTPLYVLVFVSE